MPRERVYWDSSFKTTKHDALKSSSPSSSARRSAAVVSIVAGSCVSWKLTRIRGAERSIHGHTWVENGHR